MNIVQNAKALPLRVWNKHTVLTVFLRFHTKKAGENFQKDSDKLQLVKITLSQL